MKSQKSAVKPQIKLRLDVFYNIPRTKTTNHENKPT